MLLIISPFQDDYALVKHSLQDEEWRVSVSPTVHDGLAWLRHHHAQVVISERDLPDGTWKQVLDGLPQSPKPPRLIVASRYADDRLWAEVLNLGGYDVLIKPFDRQELRRVLHLARARPQYDKKGTQRAWALSCG